MNTHAEYRRHSYVPPETTNSPEAASDISQLARHVDPSLPDETPTHPESKRIAWVRPTEFPNIAGPLIGRGVDLHAELVRRARRTPAAAVRATRRGIRHSLRPEPSAPSQEGIGL